MPRFTATDSMGTFTVLDTLNSNTVLSMSTSAIHTSGVGITTLAPSMTITEVDRAFGTPLGDQREMGFDLDFTFINSSGDDRLIGGLGLTGFNLVAPVDFLSPLGDKFQALPADVNYRKYPGDLYAPLSLIRDDIVEADFPYNICVSICYPALEYDHPFNTVTAAPTVGGVPSDIRFRAHFGNDINTAPGWVIIPDGTTRRYRLCFRINDRTDTTISKPPADNPAQEWLWTLRGYQQYFRRLYRKPDYRRMGGCDGRVIGSRNGSTNGTYHATTNPRTFSTGPLDNPSTNGTGGAPNGYFKFRDAALLYRDLNVERVIIWALAGFDVPGVDDYDPRFASGVLTLNIVGDFVGPTTVRRALQQIRETMQLGLWWGRSTEVPESDTWSNGARHAFVPSNGSDVARLRQETDLAVSLWHVQIIGLDAFGGLAFRFPGKGFRWLRDMQKRYPHALFITEANLPDVLHTIAPTYVTEDDPMVPVETPFWVQQYLSPGGECVLQINGPITGQADRVTELAALGFTVIGGWGEELGIGTRAVPRWRELGESAIPGFDSSFDRRALSSVPNIL